MIILSEFQHISQLLNLFISHFTRYKIEDCSKFIFIAKSISSCIFEGLDCFYQIQGKFISHFFGI